MTKSRIKPIAIDFMNEKKIRTKYKSFVYHIENFLSRCSVWSFVSNYFYKKIIFISLPWAKLEHFSKQRLDRTVVLSFLSLFSSDMVNMTWFPYSLMSSPLHIESECIGFVSLMATQRMCKMQWIYKMLNSY